MKIIEVKENKKQYLDLLLLADEQEDMIDRYLDNGKMYVLDDNADIANLDLNEILNLQQKGIFQMLYLTFFLSA